METALNVLQVSPLRSRFSQGLDLARHGAPELRASSAFWWRLACNNRGTSRRAMGALVFVLIYTDVHIYIYTYNHTCENMYTYTRYVCTIHIYICIYTYVCIYMHRHMYRYICRHIQRYTYTHTYLHAYIHTHAYVPHLKIYIQINR